MKFAPVAAAFALAAVSLLLAACGGSSENDKSAIADANKKWLEAIAAKDLEAITAMYAEDGALLPPNAPKAAGREAVKKAWSEFLQTPGMALTFETEKLVLASGGDLAVDISTYKFTSGEGAAQITDTGKSVVTWIKKDGKWLVLTDMFSSDAPPPAPPPPPAETPAPAEGATAPAPAEGAPATPATPTPSP